MILTSLAQGATVASKREIGEDMKVTKGMRVSTLNLDSTVSIGKVIGVGMARYWADEPEMEQTAQVVFEDFQGHGKWSYGEGYGHTWFTDMYARDLNPVDHVYPELCECGNKTYLCHPEA
jgi:hypothetical protein